MRTHKVANAIAIGILEAAGVDLRCVDRFEAQKISQQDEELVEKTGKGRKQRDRRAYEEQKGAQQQKKTTGDYFLVLWEVGGFRRFPTW